ncbi:hypothetical protein TPHA_0E03200 [Tetrapisispora phaffii CBS 4417]|uniref:Major facilitator superfamily (MFS) profile domain-containing protein n=1 Tax=Tetrapisispora phaffii (strain ATCC 24235 / CBS 4417 / NBRC 1672 / NRRL Y-8282 / UCD 70-5) TaxID=1071381 RepID=G8BU32_TETPH|nr:hypothetical protein TPHA_0E03200 [Tetrapisispora phaffii CBS 4417]CCE63410.1 hypothetical protein TPHA_0E03200 [Tetrapisispora phaffii CBS 4417]
MSYPHLVTSESTSNDHNEDDLESIKSYIPEINETDNQNDGIVNTLSQTISNLSKKSISLGVNEREEILSIVNSHREGVQRVLSDYESLTHGIGPVEEMIDKEAPHKIIPSTTNFYHEEDKWQYPIDSETGFRIVEFVDDDRDDPRTWDARIKWNITVLLGIICFVVAMMSAVVTGDINAPAAHFGVSEEVIILTVSLMVWGFGLGPLVFAPLSEELGRNWIYCTTLFVAVIFIIPCAVAQNIGTLLAFRFLDGLAFSAPMCIIGGSLSDIWRTEERGIAMSIFSAAPFLGPVMGPIVGSLLTVYCGWRWVYIFMIILSGCLYAVLFVFLPETHHQTILKRRAKKLRKLTGDQSYRAVSEIKVRTLKEIANDSLLRPLILLSELIVFLVTMYMAILYGLLYMFFFAYPVVYSEGKGWSDIKTSIMFIPIGVGVLIGTAVSPLFNMDYNRRAQRFIDKGEIPPAELRLIPMMYGCAFVPIGLFCYAWTSFPHVSWAGPCFSGFACGLGFVLLYNPANNYIVDSYQHYAASGLAAKTFVRSMWGGSVPLFTIQMYHRLGYEWASTLMAFIGLACCAIPFLFYRYGATIRKRSKYAYSPSVDVVKVTAEDVENNSNKETTNNTESSSDSY